MLKKITIISITIFCILLALPTFFSKSQQFLPSWMRPVSLGLDLKGGAQLLLSIDTDVMEKEKLNDLYEGVRSVLVDRQKGIIKFVNLKKNDNFVSFKLKNENDLSKLKGRLKLDFSENIDIKSNGKNVTISYSSKYKESLKNDALARSIEIIRHRVDALGTKELSIQSQGGKYILIQLPGVDNPERIKELIGKTAKMTFHLVNENVTNEQIINNKLPNGTEVLDYIDGGKVAIYKRVEISGESLTNSKADFDQNNMPVVTTEFDSIGARKFAKMTTEHINERFAIVLDDKVLSAPYIKEPILGGRGQISGGFTLQGAKDLAVLLRSGALPAPLNVIEERTVGAGLGSDTIIAGKLGSVIGVLFVVLFMIITYKLFGVIASFVLFVNLAMIVGLSALFGATLTLPGIAGIVLTLGMAVDANILPFERIREELKEGVPTLKAVDVGFNRSIKTVLDGNLTNLICSLILFQFGAGPIRGFAVTLSIGVVSTLFTCILLSRLIIDFYLNNKNKKIYY